MGEDKFNKESLFHTESCAAALPSDCSTRARDGQNLNPFSRLVYAIKFMVPFPVIYSTR